MSSTEILVLTSGANSELRCSEVGSAMVVVERDRDGYPGTETMEDTFVAVLPLQLRYDSDSGAACRSCSLV